MHYADFCYPFLPHHCTNLTWIKDVHTHMKCNLVNFKIPKLFPYMQNRNPFQISKLTRLHFKPICTSFIQVRSLQRWRKFWTRCKGTIYNVQKSKLSKLSFEITARTTAAWNVDFVLESSDPGRLPITIKPTNYLGNSISKLLFS